MTLWDRRLTGATMITLICQATNVLGQLQNPPTPTAVAASLPQTNTAIMTPNVIPPVSYILGVNSVPVYVRSGNLVYQGLQIVSVTPGSSAERAGLHPGDTILTAGRYTTPFNDSLLAAIRESQGVLHLLILDRQSIQRPVIANLGVAVAPVPVAAPYRMAPGMVFPTPTPYQYWQQDKQYLQYQMVAPAPVAAPAAAAAPQLGVPKGPTSTPIKPN